MYKQTWKKKAARIGYLVFVLFGVSLASFFLSALAPGDPAEIILRDKVENPGPEQILALREELGLNDPWPIQYLAWIKRVLCMDLGQSWVTGRPVVHEIWGRLDATAELALAAFALTVVLACACGGVSALFQNRLPDILIQGLAFLATAMPAFWLGTVLIYLFSMKLYLLPVAGRGDIRHLILPA
ncbi:MAG: ABC transporter permease, partial [Candidatus Electrothrix sp. EH2]|nr:ABC transporter permease [Candidatus Electrothrix sp. EH2]